MKFRPCIDIHNGKVKQIVGGSLRDRGDQAEENFVSCQDAPFYARFYQSYGIKGGHIILLNPASSPYYQDTKQQALEALGAYPQGLQVGGGIHDKNAEEFLDAGASHVIVTSFVFKDGQVSWENLERMRRAVGKEKLVLDLSCRKKDGQYYIVTDRWQKFTQVPVNFETLAQLSSCCDEFLVHAVDVEGKASGIETELVKMLAHCHEIPVTYAGGVGSFRDLEELKKAGENRVDVTIGSALDLFGGHMDFKEILNFCKN
ncbi:MAG: phosphoribosylformimino-5-aminoimidazole carboxamide ribotide isomerase [Clostridiales bacterium]|nr:phosphoribosylformimino-5-aminoimidazole carboxamide ribotide isomerase [Clostridiales bacterium]